MIVPVVLLNYNSSADCRKCVDYLKRQREVEIEIIIVDNCSREEDLVELRKLASEQECTLIENKENKGYNAGNNIGLRYAAEKGYELALIANPDMEFPQEDYISRLVSKMSEDNTLVVTASDIVGLDGVHQNPMMRDGDWHGCFGWFTGLFKKNEKTEAYDFIENYQQNHYCNKVSGCCFLIRMDFLKSIGFFDENVFLYCEEAILSRQAEFAGMKMYYLADVQAVHAHVKSDKGDPVKRFRHWGRSRIYFIEKYSGDTWWGKMMACLSMRTYVFVFSIYNRVRKLNSIF
ncbi:MAG: glycosyltransferase family 2 protein [Candidatus Cryptobacteroides sp.]